MSLKSGFTIVELLIVIAIFSVLASLTFINISRPQVSTSIDTTLNKVYSDIKIQQVKAINRLNNEYYGVFFSTNSYTLFTGSAYNPNNSDNLVINNDQGITFSSINVPSSIIVFNNLGQVQNYSQTENTVTITHSNGMVKTFSINKLGAIDVN